MRGLSFGATGMLLCGVFVAVAGCGGVGYLQAGTTYGSIAVSKPRVSTRERLINDRLEEEAWLKSQLRDSDSKDFAVQGKSDIRSFVGTFVGAGVQADKGAVAVQREKKNQELEDIRRTGVLKGLDYQIDLARKQKQLADAQAGVGSASGGSPQGAGGTTGNAGGGADSSSGPKVIAGAADQLKQLSESITKLDSELVKLAGRDTAKPMEPAPSTVTQSPIDEFRDRLAYREEIRSEIISNGLDDAHDLARHTIYRLSFDTTVFPEADTSAWAVIGVTIKPDPDYGKRYPSPNEFGALVKARVENEASDIREAVRDHCSDDSKVPGCLKGIRLETLKLLARKLLALSEKSNLLMALLNRAKQGQIPLTDEDAKEFAKVLHGKSGSTGETPTVETIAVGAYYLSRTNLFDQLLEGKMDSILKEPDSSGVRRCKFPAKRLRGYAMSNEELQVSDQRMAGITVLAELTGRTIEIGESLQVRENETCSDVFVAKAEAMFAGMESPDIYAYGATPKEMVQRISEVMSRRQVSEFALALQAVTGTASIDTMLNFVTANDALFHALRRQPLVVGFSGPMQHLDSMSQSNPASLGWIIGPKYEIKTAVDRTQSAGFRHVPVQNTVTGIVSVPAYLKSVVVEVVRCWRGERWEENSESRRCAKPESYTVTLPANPSRAFSMYDKENPSRVVTLRHGNPSKYYVKVGEAAKILIRGDNLWRNTLVLMGAQEADRISVLPDMEGIIAYFDKVKPASFSAANGTVVPLRITTSEDSQHVGDVILRDGDFRDKTGWILSGEGRAIFPGMTLGAKASPKLPDAYNDLILRIVNQTRGRVAAESRMELDYSNGNAQVKLPDAASFQKWQDGDSVTMALRLTRVPNDAAPEETLLGNAIYYSGEDKSKASYKIDKQYDKYHVAKIEFPTNFRDAYPALRGATTVTAVVSWNEADKPREGQASCNLSKQTNECTFKVGVPKMGTLTFIKLKKDSSGVLPPVLLSK